MPEVKLPDATITLDGILYIFAVAVAVCVAISSIYKGWEALKKISVRDRVKALEGRLDKVEARLQLGTSASSCKAMIWAPCWPHSRRCWCTLSRGTITRN